MQDSYLHGSSVKTAVPALYWLRALQPLAILCWTRQLHRVTSTSTNCADSGQNFAAWSERSWVLVSLVERRRQVRNLQWSVDGVPAFASQGTSLSRSSPSSEAHRKDRVKKDRLPEKAREAPVPRTASHRGPSWREMMAELREGMHLKTQDAWNSESGPRWSNKTC